MNDDNEKTANGIVFQRLERHERVIFGENGDNGIVGDLRDIKNFVRDSKTAQERIMGFLYTITGGVILMGIGGIISVVIFIVKLMPSGH